MIYDLMVFVVAVCAAYAGASIFINRFAHHLCQRGRMERPALSDTVIVLGAYTDGYRPSLPLQSRLKAALHLYRHGVVRTFVVSGGQGVDETVSEARSMKRFLLLNGVSPEVIFEDIWSKDTWENLRNSKQVMTHAGLRTAVIVTSDYHLPRALAVARTLGMEVSGYAAYSTRREFQSAMREVFAHIQYTLKGRAPLFQERG